MHENTFNGPTDRHTDSESQRLFFRDAPERKQTLSDVITAELTFNNIV
jgi:hypothetical protein